MNVAVLYLFFQNVLATLGKMPSVTRAGLAIFSSLVSLGVPGVNVFRMATPTFFSLFFSRVTPTGITSNKFPPFWWLLGARTKPLSRDR